MQTPSLTSKPDSHDSSIAFPWRWRLEWDSTAHAFSFSLFFAGKWM